MKAKSREFWCALAADEELLFADGFDGAILGVCKRMNEPALVVYDAGKVLEMLEDQGMSPEEAEEYFVFNIETAYVGERTPTFVHSGRGLDEADLVATYQEQVTGDNVIQLSLPLTRKA